MILWSDIESECQGFRQGLVATFRKYEGQPTDEKDAYGRTVKVTAASFAGHMGIAPETFRRWVKKATTVGPISAEESRQKTKEIEQWHIRRAARQAPQAIVEAVSELPEEAQQQIVRQLHQKQLERAGADFSESGRKERQARTAEHFEPFHQSLNLMKVVSAGEAFVTLLHNLPADLSEDDLREIDTVVDAATLARTELHMRAEVGR